MRDFRCAENLQSKVSKQFDVKLYMLLQARIIGILDARSYEYWFRYLHVVED